MKPFRIALTVLVGTASTLAIAQPTVKSSPATPVEVTNAAPIPVTGTVTISNPTSSVGISGTVNAAVSGAVESADQTVVISNGSASGVTSGWVTVLDKVDVKDFKEIRIAVELSGCGPCGEPIEVAVKTGTSIGAPFQIDTFQANNDGTGIVAKYGSRTYTSPGTNLTVQLRAVNGGSNTARFLVVGRSN